jgi:hypothetical protein
MLDKEVSFRRVVALGGGFRVPIARFLEILLTVVAVVKSNGQLKLREGFALLGRLPNPLVNAEVSHGRILPTSHGAGVVGVTSRLHS